MRLYDFIFLNKSFARILRHLSFWLVIELVYFTALIGIYLSVPIENEDTTLDKTIFVSVSLKMLFDMAYCYIIVYFFMPRFLFRKKYKSFIFFTILLTIIILLSEAFTALFRSGITKPGADMYALLWYTFLPFCNSGPPITCALFIAIKMLKQWYLKEQEKIILLRENKLSELQILKAQIHPHFLFNTLNNIYSFVINNRPEASGLVLQLSDTMSYMITECDAPLVSLQKEIKMITDYIGLEKVRYGNRLDMQVELSGGYSDKTIVPLLMIPFVENSFKHGTSRMLRDPWIKLFIQADENVLHFSLSNSKPADEIMNGKRGIGLSNVKKRLELLYPSNHLLTIESTVNTFTVNMRVPLQQMSEAINFSQRK